jgi:CheY-like chemotaxis protein
MNPLAPPSNQPALTLAAFAGGPLTILVIDDEADMRGILRTVLERDGHTVLLAETGAEGREIARTQQPDIILCDVFLPDISGHEVLDALHRDYQTRTIPFIFLTGCLENKSIRLGMAAGAAAYLVKPVRRDELGDVIAACQRKLAWFDQVLLLAPARCA